MQYLGVCIQICHLVGCVKFKMATIKISEKDLFPISSSRLYFFVFIFTFFVTCGTVVLQCNPGYSHRLPAVGAL